MNTIWCYLTISTVYR